MIRPVALCVILALALEAPAAAGDPDPDQRWWEEPPVSIEPQPVDDIWWWEDTALEPAPPPPPASVVPDGIYYVTEVYVADVVTVDGSLTTYSTATVADAPGTYARVVDTVRTGASSPFDGVAFNGRASLHDGRSVAGTYYENFVLAGGSFVPVSVVFFQDDSIAAAPAPTLAPGPLPAKAPLPVTGLLPIPTLPPAERPAPGPAPVAHVDPIPEAPAPPFQRRVPALRPGVTSSPLGDIAFSIEVLRGRSISLWFRVVADGVTVPVSSWRIVSGEHTALGPPSGVGDDPFRARWDRVTPPGATWLLRFEGSVMQGGVSYPVTGDITVVVRAPALIR